MIAKSLQPDLVVQSEIDEFWMAEALKLAKLASEEGEIPVGALLVQDNQLIATGYNQSIKQNDPTAHAEVIALRQAGEALDNYRLPGTTLYVTLEPCFMCAGAMIHARVERLVYGASDLKTGAAGGGFDLFNQVTHNHSLQIESGVLAEQCGQILTRFFKMRREAKRLNSL